MDIKEWYKNFNPEVELFNLTEDKVSRWIEEEWKELMEYGVSKNQAISLIIDSNYKWMKIKPENETFVYNKLQLLKK